MYKQCVVLATFALLVGSAPSWGDIVATNLSATVDGVGSITADQEYAQEFTTGSQSVNLGSIQAALGNATGTFTAAAELVNSSSDLPGSVVLTTLSVSSLGQTFTDATLTPDTADVLLAANTSYWIVLSASGTGSYQWNYTDTNNASLPLYAGNQGFGWSSGTGPFLVQINTASSINAAPEPGSFMFLCAVLSVGGVVVGMRSRIQHGVALPQR